MTAPTLIARIGQRGTQLGKIELGGPSGGLNPAPVSPTIPATATPLIAFVWNNAMTTLKATLTILNRPKFKWALNGGYDSVTLLTQAQLTSSLYGVPGYGTAPYGGVSLGDLVLLREQKGDGSVVYSGIAESIIDTYDNPAQFGLVLTPMVAELGDTGFSTNYVTPTDIAQMVRDAVASTIHLKFNNYTIPDTGQTAVYDFATTNCLDVLNLARLMAGTNYWWFVDALGYVWFQPMGFAAQHTLAQLQHFDQLTKTPDITKLKNDFTVIGGIPSGSTTAITATYVGASTATVGKRTIMPPPTFPTVTNQTVLSNIAGTIGGVLDRTINRIDMNVPNYAVPITPNQPGGPMVRYWQPAKFPLQEQSRGFGGYSPAYIALENERDGPIQKLKLGDIPVNNVDDLKYMLDNIVRYWTVNASSVNPTIIQPAAGGVVSNSAGNSIVDGTGLVSTSMLSLVLQLNGLNGTSSAATFGPIGNVGIITASRTQSFLAFAMIRCQTSGTSEPSCFWRLNVGGSLSETVALDGGVGLPINNSFTLFVVALALARGDYTVAVEVESPVGTATLVDGTVNVFLLGS